MVGTASNRVLRRLLCLLLLLLLSSAAVPFAPEVSPLPYIVRSNSMQNVEAVVEELFDCKQQRLRIRCICVQVIML